MKTKRCRCNGCRLLSQTNEYLPANETLEHLCFRLRSQEERKQASPVVVAVSAYARIVSDG